MNNNELEELAKIFNLSEEEMEEIQKKIEYECEFLDYCYQEELREMMKPFKFKFDDDEE